MLTWKISRRDESNKEILRPNFTWFVGIDLGTKFP